MSRFSWYYLGRLSRQIINSELDNSAQDRWHCNNDNNANRVDNARDATWVWSAQFNISFVVVLSLRRKALRRQ